ncbi:hypothetical protein [Mycobacteroides abscessus]|uniref:hypothetical protein n=1 Tax=Mycobacteroides abscessus TaxID=36809 RepID=UPI000929F29E|nr:hypothetical protein [Mycobacteroides abscessus]SIH60308.1 Uncharacterised protein [Mycobacteroides abscessus subsp. abscessus]SIN52473.1 Uncharacterised protein [Mycobacteroides abscessus subsp. abscessus]SLI56908.1 Uncharacterised protein [Mycobacteroides abscessus subsp. abscessus]
MSEDTARELERLRAAEAQQSELVNRLKRECLESVADGLVAKLDNHAKDLAHKQPEVAKELGPDGIGAMRRELAEAGRELADELPGAIDEIEWPAAPYLVDKHRIHSALFDFLQGKRMTPFTRVLSARGFKLDGLGVIPQHLYDINNFEELASAMRALAQAERDVQAAQQADDRATVESLWEGPA